MPALNDKPQWAAHVAAGLTNTLGMQHKRTTIRKINALIAPEKTLYHYTGLRLGGWWLDQAEAEALAQLDTAGHWSLEALLAFFEEQYGFPARLQLILW